MYKGAIIGLGNVALNGHIPAWKKKAGFEIVAGVDSSAERRVLFQKLMPGAKCFSSMEECAGEKVDFADICTPPYTHFELAKRILDRKIHVLCEKPLVFSSKEFEELKRISEENSLALVTVHNWKFAPICLKIKELLSEKVAGELKYCSWYVLRNGPAGTALGEDWRMDPKKAGGGILMDHGWHAFYLILDWLTGKPGKISAVLENRRYEDLPVEDTAKVKIIFEDAVNEDVTAEIFLSWGSRLRKNSGVIEGSDGSIQIEDDRLITPKGTFRFPQALSEGSHHPEWFEKVIEEFSAEVRDEKQRGKNLRIAGDCLTLIERCKESSSTGKEIQFLNP